MGCRRPERLHAPSGATLPPISSIRVGGGFPGIPLAFFQMPVVAGRRPCGPYSPASSMLCVAIRAATPVRLAHQIAQGFGTRRLAGGRIQIAGRFVGQQQARTIGQGAGDGDALLPRPPDSCAGWWLSRWPRSSRAVQEKQLRRVCGPRLLASSAGDPHRQGRRCSPRPIELGQQMVDIDRRSPASVPDACRVRASFVRGFRRARSPIDGHRRRRSAFSNSPAACSSDDLPEPGRADQTDQFALDRRPDRRPSARSSAALGLLS